MDHCFGSCRTRFLKAVCSTSPSTAGIFRTISHAASGFYRQIWSELEELNTSSVLVFAGGALKHLTSGVALVVLALFISYVLWVAAHWGSVLVGL